jgi:hypothetical protein
VKESWACNAYSVSMFSCMNNDVQFLCLFLHCLITSGFTADSHYPENPCSMLMSSPVSYSMKPLMLEAILG